MNPWVALVCCALIACSYLAGRHGGEKITEASALRDEKIAQQVYDKAMEATSKAISKLEVKHVTYKQKIEREIKEVPVYRSLECQHTPDGLRIINSALTNGAEPAGDRQLPTLPRSVDGLKFRGNNGETGRGVGDLLSLPGSGPYESGD